MDILEKITVFNRSEIINEEVDYLSLKHILRAYPKVRDKITSLLRSGVLIRVKKGLYVIGPNYARKPFSRETLANLIYGPSYISLYSALAYYGLIPERVEIMTSVTSKRDKEFDTPVGRFTYRYLAPAKFSVGVTRIEIDQTHSVLFATREKTIADMLALEAPLLGSQKHVETYLLDDLRIEEEELLKLRLGLIQDIALAYKSSNVSYLLKFFQRRVG